MEDGGLSVVSAVQALAKAHKIKVAEEQALVEKCIQLVAEGQRTCEKLKYDLDDQTESRRHWQRRATDAESTLAKVQQIMVLVDGSQHFFSPNLIRGGLAGARQAADTLLTEAKEYARTRHKNDLPENISVVVHIFSDICQLARDLYDSQALSDPGQLGTFVQELCSFYPGFTISDCRGGRQTVDAKMKYFYELFLENSHCRHLFLALADDSGYHEVLQSYRDDEYTKSKTSLVRSMNGSDPCFDLPFHTVEFSSLESAYRPTTGSVEASFTLNGRVEAPLNSEGHSSKASITDGRGSKSVGPVSSMTRFHSSDPRSSPVSKADTARATQEAPVLSTSGTDKWGEASVGTHGHAGTAPEDLGLADVIKLESSTHTSSQSNKAADQPWEAAAGNTYVPAPMNGEWGEEPPTSQPEPAEAPEMDMNRVSPRRITNSNRKNQGQNLGKKQDYRAAHAAPRSSRRVPKQFEGSWDDMVQEQWRPNTQASSPSPKPILSSTRSAGSRSSVNDHSRTFSRQVVSMPEPDPIARPVRSPIALNKLDQRIDLKLPRALPEDWERFELRIKNRGLCNEHHLRSNCNNPKCPFDHELIDNGVYLILRIKARTLACSIGPECRRHDCFGGHQCPNVSNNSSCGRFKCPFEAMHSVSDFEIVQTIPPPPAVDASTD